MSAAEACIEFRAGVGSLPYLADHGFQDMLVLPGSFYLELARRLARERWRRPARALRNVSFDRPIVLGAEDALIRLDVTEHGDGRASCAFREAAGDDAARLEIELDAPGAPGPAAGPFSIDAFQAQSDEVLAAERFYAMLRENGNQYGPSFQRVAALWRTAHEALGKISLPPRDGDADAQALHPSVLDALIQVLASLVIDAGRTFVLRSIERVELPGRDLPDTLWAHAVRLRGGGGETSLVGDVRAFDRSGRACLELCGVELALLERAGGNERSTAESVVVAANFTADPVEDSLRFWGEHFGAPLRVGFAPYDQVFQQLLDPGSALRANRDGVNVVLLALEEWAARDGQAGMTLDSERAQRCFAGRSRYLLPNGLEIVHLNRYETDYLYQEVFEDQCYLRHGIALPDGATVLDIGANIGLFSLFVLSRCRNPRIYAFEPAPAVYELLQANCEAYGAANVRAVNLGVSDQARTASLTFYEKSSVFSGFYADEAADRAALQAVVRNTLSRETAAEDESVAEYVTELTADRLRGTPHECRLTSVSDIIREHRLDRIDLLKIDAEKSELDIIKGIGDDDWPKIAQLVVEIHDPSYESVRRIRTLLGAKGFRCEVEHEQMLEHSGLFNLYAIRDDAPAASRASRARRLSDGLQRNVREFCAALGGFMQQSAAPLILCLCPRTPAAEADRELSAALSDAERSLLAQAGATANVHALGSDTALRRYPVADYYDPDGHRLGHIPYTPACYAAIGTALYRTIFNLRRKPYKVIVLDCDNTLWQGACGEDGPLGVELSEPYRGLQQFMLGQMNAGMLLCLCSKNNEQDVLQVFDRRSDMVLRREHLVSWRINWNRKSDNLRSLADELGLGLDSFIFVDD
ncbi:MAG: FkbM family methyltransferase, partial [Burkholderiales bacterium]